MHINSDEQLGNYEYRYCDDSITLNNITDKYIHRVANSMDFESIVINNSTFESIHVLEFTCLDFCVINSNIKIMPELPFSENIYCSGNGITQMQGCDVCEILHCSGNALKCLPDLVHCTEIDCSYNNITRLPKLSNCKKFIGNNNLLTEIPYMAFARKIYVHNNKLMNLTVPEGCMRLKCYGNPFNQNANVI